MLFNTLPAKTQERRGIFCGSGIVGGIAQDKERFLVSSGRKSLSFIWMVLKRPNDNIFWLIISLPQTKSVVYRLVLVEQFAIDYSHCHKPLKHRWKRWWCWSAHDILNCNCSSVQLRYAQSDCTFGCAADKMDRCLEEWLACKLKKDRRCKSFVFENCWWG